MSEPGAQRPADPDWIGEAIRVSLGELRLFLGTALAFLRGP
jgi:hypothetical protein